MDQKRKYQKALETIVYLSKKDHRNYWILKTIYFADKEHLTRYGRQIFDDDYRAMKQGPVPSLAYDIVKNVRGDGWFAFNNPDPSLAISVPDTRTIIPLREPNISLLSNSDVECLDLAYDRIKDLTFDQLKDLSHDDAYKAVNQDEEMSIESIITTLDNCEDVLKYIHSN